MPSSITHNYFMQDVYTQREKAFRDIDKKNNQTVDFKQL